MNNSPQIPDEYYTERKLILDTLRRLEDNTNRSSTQLNDLRNDLTEIKIGQREVPVLRKHLDAMDDDLVKLREKVVSIETRVLWLTGGVAFVMSAIINFLKDLFRT